VSGVLKLNDLLNYLKKKNTPPFAHYYIGKLNTKNDNSLGIYNLNRSTGEYMAIGGEETTKARSKYLSLLVHGNKNKSQTETLAYTLYDALKSTRYDKVGEHEISYIKLLCDEPIDVDMDSNGVYEYVIELQIYYK
jgi:hypothetical protein